MLHVFLSNTVPEDAKILVGNKRIELIICGSAGEALCSREGTICHNECSKINDRGCSSCCEDAVMTQRCVVNKHSFPLSPLSPLAAVHKSGSFSNITPLDSHQQISSLLSCLGPLLRQV